MSSVPPPSSLRASPDHIWRRAISNRRVVAGGLTLLVIVAACFGSMIATLRKSGPLYYDGQRETKVDQPPAMAFTMERRVAVPRSGQQKRAPDPSGIQAVLATPKALTLEWPDKYAGESGYLVERRQVTARQSAVTAAPSTATPSTQPVQPATRPSDDFAEVARLPADTTQWVDTSVEAGSAYFYRVKPIGKTELAAWFGTDRLGRSLLGRCLLGGTISLFVGLAAAAISVVIGVSVGLVAGYRGGWIDASLMRFVDIMYGLPYILQVILFKVAFEPQLERLLGGNTRAANIVVMFVAIGLVSWLTMSRVVRGQVLSLRSQPFIEACRAAGLPEWRIFLKHLLPNLVGPITVYATLTVPQAVLQESFLSFLGIGVSAPMPSWGNLAADGLPPALNPLRSLWWQLVFPCALLALTLLSLNFLGDGLRDLFDPKREAAKL
jgi:oligopeptide transport system permease protein